MRLHSKTLRISTSVAVFAVAAAVVAKVIPMPPKPSDVVGAWSGYAEDHLSFLRLELDADNKGYFSVKYLPDTPPRLYRIESWRLSDSVIEIQTQPIDTEAEAVVFKKVKLSISSLEGKFGGKGWERQVTLFSDRAWQSQSGPTQDRIARYRKDGQ